MTGRNALPDKDIPEKVIQVIVNRILAEVPQISRVLIDLTSKPPGKHHMCVNPTQNFQAQPSTNNSITILKDSLQQVVHIYLIFTSLSTLFNFRCNCCDSFIFFSPTRFLGNLTADLLVIREYVLVRVMISNVAS
jgi:hypothetical protein